MDRVALPMRVPLAVVLAVVFHALGGCAAASTNDSCMPSPSSLEDGAPCPSCCAAMQQLPLQQWSEESTANSFQLPWGQQYPFPALDYEEIVDKVCDCLDTGDELPGEICLA